MEENVSQDFVFGTLATDELRLVQMRAARSGVAHAHHLEPLDPQPGEPVVVHVRVGPAVCADRVSCYYTTDDSDPAGARGVATSGQTVDLARTGVAWDTLLWGYRETWAGSVPPLPSGTLVRYRIEAWSELRAESHWASEIAGVVAGERPPGVSEMDAQLFASPGSSLWPLRRSGSYAYHVD